MTKGGYITIIGVFLFMLFYQNYRNDKSTDELIEVYKEVAIFNATAGETISDTIKSEISSLKDSINDVNTIASLNSKTSDTVIKKTYIKNIYVLPNVEKVVSDKIETQQSLMLTNSE